MTLRHRFGQGSLFLALFTCMNGCGSVTIDKSSVGTGGSGGATSSSTSVPATPCTVWQEVSFISPVYDLHRGAGDFVFGRTYANNMYVGVVFRLIKTADGVKTEFDLISNIIEGNVIADYVGGLFDTDGSLLVLGRYFDPQDASHYVLMRRNMESGEWTIDHTGNGFALEMCQTHNGGTRTHVLAQSSPNEPITNLITTISAGMETSLPLPTDASYIHSIACHPDGAIAIAAHKSPTPDTYEGHAYLLNDLQTADWQELPLQNGTGPAYAVTFLENGDILVLTKTFDVAQSTGGFYTWQNGQLFDFESIPDFIAGSLLHDTQGTLIGGNSFDWKQRLGHLQEGKIVWDAVPEATGPMVPLWRGTDESLYMSIAKNSSSWQLFNCVQ